MKLQERIKTRGPEMGHCNICGNFGKLTDDHIPPKGASRLSQVAMMNIIDLFQVELPKKSTRYAQDGVKYRTLCAHCNNTKLGANLDPTLIKLSLGVGQYLESKISLPLKQGFDVEVNKLMRCVVGHLLAYGLDGHKGGTVIDELRNYFLNPTAKFHQGLKVYYWVYPYQDQVIIKSASKSMHYWNSFAVFMLLKFFPITFFFVIDEPSSWNINQERLDILLCDDINKTVSMPISFTNIPHRRWPEAPEDSGIVLYGEAASAAVPLIQKAKPSTTKP